ncbi:890_t:CDS:2 [Funneliformis mosseae]|uniref:890_t:CDS:1 n=1 Tax=Funneliformis mosseae TaxID=27381 RepID=A0A9N9F7J1_FUNMO|nr:890_t:CDS:2 [Funneliformis mosseae]
MYHTTHLTEQGFEEIIRELIGNGHKIDIPQIDISIGMEKMSNFPNCTNTRRSRAVARTLVNIEVRQHLPNVTEFEIRKTTELALKIYRLFSVVEGYSKLESLTASEISLFS